MTTKPWWIWRWQGGGGNSVSTERCSTKAKALSHARELGTPKPGGHRGLVVDESTLKRVSQAEFEKFDHELYMMWV